jgi:hypothetical protein
VLAKKRQLLHYARLQNSHLVNINETPVFQPSQALHLSLSYQALGKI